MVPENINATPTEGIPAIKRTCENWNTRLPLTAKKNPKKSNEVTQNSNASITPLKTLPSLLILRINPSRLLPPSPMKFQNFSHKPWTYCYLSLKGFETYFCSLGCQILCVSCILLWILSHIIRGFLMQIPCTLKSWTNFVSFMYFLTFCQILQQIPKQICYVLKSGRNCWTSSNYFPCQVESNNNNNNNNNISLQ